jgi:tetratricopeptide (TPR) repeat protein
LRWPCSGRPDSFANSVLEEREKYSALVKREPNNAAAHLMLGMAYVESPWSEHQSEDILTGVEEFKISAKLDPTCLNPIFNIANSLHVEKGKTPEAIRYYNEVVKRDPKDLQAMTYMANAHERIGEIDKSIKIHEQVIAAGSGRAILMSLNNLSYIYDKRGDKVKAADYDARAKKVEAELKE